MDSSWIFLGFAFFHGHDVGEMTIFHHISKKRHLISSTTGPVWFGKMCFF